MIDPACEYNTLADALKVGRACDEARFFWYEDPYKDGGISAFAHRKLRQMIKTPILIGEHIRGIELHVDKIVADGTDFVRADADYDGGITGLMKIAHVGRGLRPRLRDPRARPGATATAWPRSATPTTTSSAWSTRSLGARSAGLCRGLLGRAGRDRRARPRAGAARARPGRDDRLGLGEGALGGQAGIHLA